MGGLKRLLEAYWGVLQGKRAKALIAIGLATISGCAEALGLVGMVPVLAGSDLNVGALLPRLLLLSAFLVLAALLRLAADRSIARLTVDVELDCRVEVGEALIAAPWKAVSDLSQGEVTAAVMSRSTAVSNAVAAFLQAITSGIIVLVLLVGACLIAPVLVGAAAVFLGIVAIIMRARLGFVRTNERRLVSATDEVGEQLSSSLADLKYLRLSASDRSWAENASASAEALAGYRYLQLVLPLGTRAIIDVTSAVFLTMLVGLGLVILEDPASAIVFVALFARMAPRLQAVQHFTTISVAGYSWITSWKQSVLRLAAAPQSGSAACSSTLTLGAAPRIEFKDVSFRYQEDAPNVIDKLNLIIRPGDRLAIVGGSGSGKSTFLDLLLGLFPPSQGQVLINGSLLDDEEFWSFRRSVGLVPQDVPLRRGSIRENIEWDHAKSEERLQRAIDRASLRSFVDESPRGLETTIQSRNIGLSGGQRQRIGIARALYRDPSVLVLDEATSALDMTTEASFLETLDSLPSDLTVIAVSHRLAILDHVDNVLDLSQTKSIEEFN